MGTDNSKKFTARFDDEMGTKLLELQKFYKTKTISGALMKSIADIHRVLSFSDWDEYLVVTNEKRKDKVKFCLK